MFGLITNEQGGLNFKVIGIARNAVKIGMMNVVCNMRHFVRLRRVGAPVTGKINIIQPSQALVTPQRYKNFYIFIRIATVNINSC